jgi:hypothetical protein
MPRNGASFETKAGWLRERMSAPTLPPAPAPASFAERHFSVAEIAAMWSLSQDAVRKIFQNEPGVLALGGSGAGHKRRYLTLRVPQSVVERVHRRMTKV